MAWHAAFLALSLVSLIDAAGCSEPAGASARAPASPSGEVRLATGSTSYVTVEDVKPRAERVVADLPAQISMDEDHTVRVLSPVVGRIARLDARPGDRVAAGQALAHVVSNDVTQAGSDLAKATAAAQQAENALRRARDLYANHVIALKDLQQVESDAAQALAERDRASARTRQLGVQGAGIGQTFVLRSPIAGEVVDRTANPGAEVRPDNAQALFTVSSLDTVWVTANLYQRDVGATRAGQRVVFTSDALPGRAVEARVSWVSDALDPVTRTAALRAVVPNRDRALKTQLFGRLRVYAADTSGVPVVPSVALVTRGTGSVVYVETAPGRFVRRTVTVASDDGSTAVITSGLAVGARVVTRGSLLLDAEADRQAAAGTEAGGR